MNTLQNTSDLTSILILVSSMVIVAIIYLYQFTIVGKFVDNKLHTLKRTYLSIKINILKHHRETTNFNNENNESVIKTRESNKLTLSDPGYELSYFLDSTEKLKINNYLDLLKNLRKDIKNNINFRNDKLSMEQVGMLCYIKKGLKDCNYDLGKPKKPADKLFFNNKWIDNNFKTVLPDNQLSYEDWRLAVNLNKL